jgi:hypothetical protein
LDVDHELLNRSQVAQGFAQELGWKSVLRCGCPFALALPPTESGNLVAQESRRPLPASVGDARFIEGPGQVAPRPAIDADHALHLIHVSPQPGFDPIRRRPLAGPHSRQLSHFIVGAGRLRVLHVATMAQGKAISYLNFYRIFYRSIPTLNPILNPTYQE